MLSGLVSAFRQRRDLNPLLIQILERLTLVNPGDRGNWESWLTALAATGDEDRLRVELRQLLAGVKEMSLTEATRELLQLYVADSYWRSIVRQLHEGKAAVLADALWLVTYLAVGSALLLQLGLPGFVLGQVTASALVVHGCGANPTLRPVRFRNRVL